MNTQIINYKVQYFINEAKKSNFNELKTDSWYINHLAHILNEAKRIFESNSNEALNHTLWHLFSQCKPVPGDEEIIVAGYVLGDGRGDFAAEVNTAKHLQKHYPSRTVRLVAVSAMIHANKLSAPQLKAADIAYFGNNFFTGSPDILESDLPFPLLDRVRNAGLILHGNLTLQKIFDPIKEEIAKKSISFHEYDMNTNLDPIGPLFGMGLEKKNIGIFVASSKKPALWETIPNHLKDVLTRDFFFCYMQSIPAIDFIGDVAKFSLNSSKDINICFCAKDKLFPIEIAINSPEIVDQGIGIVKILTFSQDKEKVLEEKVFTIGSGQKILRIIYPGNLSPKEFKTLLRLSAPLVGVTGDNSLAQALSYDKIIFYEVRKRRLNNALAEIIKEQLGEGSAYYKYFLRLDVPNAIQDPDLENQAKVISAVIKKEHSVNATLKGLVNERLLALEDPEYADKVAQWRQNYLDGELTIQEFASKVREELVKRELFNF